MFSNAEVPTPMAFYIICPFLGPELGPILNGFINQHLYWRWTSYILMLWSFVQVGALIVLVPETYIRDPQDEGTATTAIQIGALMEKTS